MDPLADLDITVQSFDIPRTVSVYPDQAGVRWWTKAWFNNRKDGEASVENPMGLGRRSVPLAARVQNLLLEDFLGYLALMHRTWLGSWDDGLKKKPSTRP